MRITASEAMKMTVTEEAENMLETYFEAVDVPQNVCSILDAKRLILKNHRLSF